MGYNNIIIECVGKDSKLHFCNPSEQKAICGMKIDSKKILKNDYSTRYWCIECDYTADELEERADLIQRQVATISDANTVVAGEVEIIVKKD